jgi:hypothetical protein
MPPGINGRMIPNDSAEIVIREQGPGNQRVCDKEFMDRRFLFRGEDPQMAVASDAPRPPTWAFLLDSIRAIECLLWNLCVAVQAIEPGDHLFISNADHNLRR